MHCGRLHHRDDEIVHQEHAVADRRTNRPLSRPNLNGAAKPCLQLSIHLCGLYDRPRVRPPCVRARRDPAGTHRFAVRVFRGLSRQTEVAALGGSPGNRRSGVRCPSTSPRSMVEHWTVNPTDWVRFPNHEKHTEAGGFPALPEAPAEGEAALRRFVRGRIPSGRKALRPGAGAADRLRVENRDRSLTRMAARPGSSPRPRSSCVGRRR
jgi:hypothetical protein